MDVLNQKGGVVLTDCLPETVIAQGDPVAVLHQKWLQFPGKTGEPPGQMDLLQEPI